MTEAPLKKIANKADVWHLVRQGSLIQFHLDLETTGLEQSFAQITSYGDAVGDIAGNFIDSTEMAVRLPDRTLASPSALLVTRTHPEELYNLDRLPHREAMGRIVRRMETASRFIEKLGLPEKEVTFKTRRKIGEEDYGHSYTERILEYPLKNEKGEAVSDVRYHPERDRFAYRVDDNPASPYYENVENNCYTDKSDGSKWKFTEPRTLFSGYRIKWADFFWLRSNMVRAGYHPANIFFTHARATLSDKQKPKNFAIDGYTVGQNTHLYGPQGEEGLKISERVDPQTGEMVPTAKLGKMMAANTRYENDRRNVRRGVFMPDGSRYDERRAHRSPAYDAQASFSLYNYCRDIAPDIVKTLEMQADEQYLRRLLPGLDPLDPRPPIYAMMRNTYPNTPTADPVAFIGFDDQLGQLRRALMINLEGDLRHYTYNGRALPDMSADDFVLMIKEQARDPGHLIRLESVRKWQGVVPLEHALSVGARREWDYEQITANFQFLVEQPQMLERIREAVERINWEVYNRPDPANPMMEEQWTRNGFGDLDYMEEAVNQEKLRQGRRRMPLPTGSVPGVVELIYNKALDIYKYHNTVDELLHRLALQPHPIDWSDDPADMDNFKDLLKKAKKRLLEKNCPFADEVLDEFLDANGKIDKDLTPEEAREFRWNILKRFLNDDEAERQNPKSRYRDGLFDYKYTKNGRVLFANLSRDFVVTDKKGRELPVDYLKNQYGRNPNLVQKRIESGEWRIKFYRLSSEPSVTATLFQFADAGKLSELDPVWQNRYESLRRLYLNGAPNEDPSQARWNTFDKVRQDLKRIEVNAAMDRKGGVARAFHAHASGEAEVFARTDEGQRIIADYRRLIDDLAKSTPLTPAFARAVNYHPDTGLAYDRIENEIPAEKAVIINVPDAHLRAPLEDIRLSPYSLIVPHVKAAQRKKIEEGAPVLLRGTQTGRLYYPGPVTLMSAPAEEQTLSLYFEKARRAYVQDSGEKFPPVNRRDALVIQKLQPVAHTRPSLDPSLQSLKVPALFFDGLTAPRLAYFPAGEPLTGLLLPADYCPQVLEAGKPMRLREIRAPMGARLRGIEDTETGHTYETTLRSVEKVTMTTLLTRVSSGQIDDTRARRYGFAGAVDMWEKVNQSFLDAESPDSGAEEVLLLEFDPVDKTTWAYFNPAEAPEAALSYGGQPVPPSAYRWAVEAPPANDNAVTPAQKKFPRPRKG